MKTHILRFTAAGLFIPAFVMIFRNSNLSNAQNPRNQADSKITVQIPAPEKTVEQVWLLFYVKRDNHDDPSSQGDPGATFFP